MRRDDGAAWILVAWHLWPARREELGLATPAAILAMPRHLFKTPPLDAKSGFIVINTQNIEQKGGGQVAVDRWERPVWSDPGIMLIGTDKVLDSVSPVR